DMRFALALLVFATSFGPRAGSAGSEARAAWQTGDEDLVRSSATTHESRLAFRVGHSRGRDLGWKLHREAGLPVSLTPGTIGACGATSGRPAPSSPSLSVSSHGSRAPPLG